MKNKSEREKENKKESEIVRRERKKGSNEMGRIKGRVKKKENVSKDAAQKRAERKKRGREGE